MDIIDIIIKVFAIFFAITIHEAAHGWAALKLGDPTAYNMGRVTLNPIAHIDLIGTIILPAIMIIIGGIPFGWAKPVPVNPLNLRNPRRDNIWISAAGPVSNLTMAALTLVGIKILQLIRPEVKVFLYSYMQPEMGGLLRSFHPLEGLMLILFFLALINTFLAVFNLIPIPPLDGSGILMGFLSEEAAQKYDRIRPFGIFIILGIFYLGLFQIIVQPIQLFLLTVIFF